MKKVMTAVLCSALMLSSLSGAAAAATWKGESAPVVISEVPTAEITLKPYETFSFYGFTAKVVYSTTPINLTLLPPEPGRLPHHQIQAYAPGDAIVETYFGSAVTNRWLVHIRA